MSAPHRHRSLFAAAAGACRAGRAPSGWSSSLSNHRVLMTSSFTGADLVLFGSIERDAQTCRAAAATTSSSP